MVSRIPLLAKVWSKKTKQFSNAAYFHLPKATWSLNELRVLTEGNNSVVTDDKIDHLAQLACINLKCSRVSKSEILKDINIILNCSRALQVKHFSSDF